MTSQVLLSCLVVLLTIINFSSVTPIDGSTCNTPSPTDAKLQNVDTFLNSNQIHYSLRHVIQSCYEVMVKNFLEEKGYAAK